MIVPLAIATVWFRRRARRLYDESRERIAIVNARLQESLSGVRESQAFGHEGATIERFHELGTDYLDARGSPRSGSSRCTSRSSSSWPRSPTRIVLGVGADLVSSGQLSTGALIAFLLYINMFFSPIQQLSQVFDAWQQTRVSVARIGELMALDTMTPQAPDAGRAAAAERRARAGGRAVRLPRHRAGGAARHRPAGGRGETVALVGETGAGKSTRAQAAGALP